MAASSNEILMAQLRESYGRIIYTHKTHEKMADIYQLRDERIRRWQLILSVVVTSGIVATIGTEIYGNGSMCIKIISAVVSFVLALLTAIVRNSNYTQLVQQHREVAATIWVYRERYFCVLSDYMAVFITEQEALKRRDKLNEDLFVIYKNAPRSSSKAYEDARKALKLNEEMTFSDEEIDAFLSKEMRKGVK